MNIGNKIKEHREKNKLSQEMLSEKLGVSRQSISKWELGQALPEIDKVVAMSRLFGVTTDELLVSPQPEIVIIKPEKYEDINEIIEWLQKINKTVVVDFEETGEEVTEQIKYELSKNIDDWSIKKIHDKSLICSSMILK